MVVHADDPQERRSVDAGKSGTAEMPRFRMRRRPFEQPFRGPPTNRLPRRAPPPPAPPLPKAERHRLMQPAAVKPAASAPRIPGRRDAPVFSNKPTPPPKETRQTERRSLGLVDPRELERLALAGSLQDRIRIACSDHTELALQVVASPALPESAVLKIAQNPMTSSTVLAYLAQSRRFRCNRQVIRALLHNPKTPPHASLAILPLIQRRDLMDLSRRRDLPEPLLQRVRFLLEGRKHKR